MGSQTSGKRGSDLAAVTQPQDQAGPAWNTPQPRGREDLHSATASDFSTQGLRRHLPAHRGAARAQNTAIFLPQSKAVRTQKH